MDQTSGAAPNGSSPTWWPPPPPGSAPTWPPPPGAPPPGAPPPGAPPPQGSPPGIKFDALIPIYIGWEVLGPAIAVTVLAGVAVGLRIYTRAVLMRRIAAEDWVILSSLCLSIIMTTLIGCQVGNKAGWHPGEVGSDTLSKLITTVNALYQVLVNVTKSSFVLQYYRLFPQRKVKNLCLFLLVVITCAGLWGLYGILFICRPLRKAWELGMPGYCFDARPYWLSAAGIGIVLDFVIWLFPMPLVGGLHLPLRQKITVMLVFALGGFVCIFSCLRLALLEYYSSRNNMKKSGIAAVVWSTVEANVGIICASLMALKPLVRKIFPRLLELSKPSQRHIKLRRIGDSSSNSRTETGWSFSNPSTRNTWRFGDISSATDSKQNRWTWGHTCDTVCAASSRGSIVAPPNGLHSILITRDTLVEDEIPRCMRESEEGDKWDDEKCSINTAEQPLHTV